MVFGSASKAIPRHELLATALELGILRPESLTEVELVERIQQVSEGHSAHAAQRPPAGWLSVARHLVASVVEQGLNLPSAARVIRDSGRPRSVPPQRPPLPTVTLAQIYIAQGHDERALSTLEHVLGRDPSHAKAGRLAQELRERLGRARAGATATSASPSASESPNEAAAVPEHDWGRPEAIVVVRDRTGADIHWELAARAELARRRSRHLEVRVLRVTPSHEGARSEQTRHPVEGGATLRVPCAPQVVVRAALGLVDAEEFEVLAVASSHVRVDGGAGSEQEFIPYESASDGGLVARIVGPAVARQMGERLSGTQVAD